MKTKISSNLNWTKNTKFKSKIFYPENIEEIKSLLKKKNVIFAGNQRSFGDNAINIKTIVSLKRIKKIVSFDKKKGIINVESGILLSEVLKVIVPHGWILPVMPGSKYVSVGGVIANNVFGKNSKKNQLKYHLKEIKLVLENGKLISCSKRLNSKIFNLTVGGFGLSGAIISAKIKLKKINTSKIIQNVISFNNYENFFNVLENIDKHEYTLSWIKTLEKNKIEGLLYLGNHEKNKKAEIITSDIKDKKLNFMNFFILKIFTQNFYLLRILNNLFFFFKKNFFRKKVSWNEFFFPQDEYTDFNRIYGKNGFIQLQFVVSKNDLIKILNKVSLFFRKNKIFSTFIIIKKMSEKGNYLTFYGNGISVSLDIPINQNYKKLRIFFNKLFTEENVRINFSKDSITNYNYIRNLKGYNQFKRNLKNLNKKRNIRSLFSVRSNL